MLQNRAELEETLTLVWDAFQALSSRRGIAVGVGGAVMLPVAFSEICVAADRYGFSDTDSFQQFLGLMSALDSAYLEHVGKK